MTPLLKYNATHAWIWIFEVANLKKKRRERGEMMYLICLKYPFKICDH